MNRSVDRQKLLNWITMVSFCVTDITLYLDTHPDDEEAIEYFNNYNTIRQQAIEEYTRLFGPLVLDAYHPTESWDWSLTPMPWEGGNR